MLQELFDAAELVVDFNTLAKDYICAEILEKQNSGVTCIYKISVGNGSSTQKALVWYRFAVNGGTNFDAVGGYYIKGSFLAFGYYRYRDSTNAFNYTSSLDLKYADSYELRAIKFRR
jgi:hypothetical protein